MKIFHVADIHLGRRRLDGRLPDKDLADAFAFVAQRAIAATADVFLIAGDLFDRAQVEPPHLRQAHQVLIQLKRAGIPVIAIEGNHDRAFLHSENPTWLSYLAEDDLLILLRTVFDASGPLLVPWDPARKSGAWLDFRGIRFVGAGYLGAATPHKVREIAARLEPERSHVLLLHAGPEYFVGEGGGFSSADLEALREKVCYLALGHIHKPMLHADWACNPGSVENCDVREAAQVSSRGYAVVEVDPACRQKPVSLQIHDTPRRPCLRLELDCTPFGNKLKHGAATLVEAAAALIRSRGAGPETVIDLRLTGRLNLDRIAFDPAVASTAIEEAAQVCAVAIDLAGLNVEESTTILAGVSDGLSRDALEQTVIRKLVEAEHLWGLDGRQEEFAVLCYEFKEAVRAGKLAEDLAERISRSHLVELVSGALAAAPPPENAHQP